MVSLHHALIILAIKCDAPNAAPPASRTMEESTARSRKKLSRHETHSVPHFLKHAKRNGDTALPSKTAAECLVQFPLTHPNPTVYISSIGVTAYEFVHKQKNSFLYDMTSFDLFKKPDHPLWLFTDNTWDRMHGRTIITPQEFLFPVCVLDTFRVEQWLMNVSRTGGALDKFYNFAGWMEPCDQPLVIKSGKLLVRKIAAIRHAVNNVPDGTTVIWLDSDTTFKRKLDEHFYSFVRRFDICYIPFTSNRQWDEHVISNFNSIESPYWRIESGILALFVTNNNASRILMEITIDLYRGGLLSLVTDCLHNLRSRPICKEIYFQRNVYLDDIFAFSMVLHHTKDSIRQGWFWVDEESGYVLSHINRSMTPYTSDFDLFSYIHHAIGSGAYSTSYRKKRKMPLDPELKFSEQQKFNDTLEFRFLGATEERLQDEYWRESVLERRKQVFENG